MAKRAAKKPPKPVLVDTSGLAGDASNPRKITTKAAAGLRASLERFGDLSGIVWNKRSRELVCGHQRVTQIRAAWGDKPIELVDAENQVYGIRVDAKRFFPVRVVSWTLAMQRAANVAANSQKIAGDFTEDIGVYLQEVAAELAIEAPGLLQDVLLADLVEVDAAVAFDEEKITSQVAGSYQVIVQCTDALHQGRVYYRLNKEGLACKMATL